MLRRWHHTNHFREPGDGCPFCGRESDYTVTKHNSELRKKLEDTHNQIELMKDKIGLQEEVIKEQIKGIYEYIKSKKPNPS